MSNPFKKLATKESFEYHMLNADGDEMYFVDEKGVEDKERPVIFEIYSTDSKVFLNDTKALAKAYEKKKGKLSLQDQQDIMINTIKTSIKSWKNLPDFDGGEIVFSDEMKELFSEYTDLGYMHRQITAEAARISNFKQA